MVLVALIINVVIAHNLQKKKKKNEPYKWGTICEDHLKVLALPI